MAKFDSAGVVIGVKSLGGSSGTISGKELVLDSEGNIYVRGVISGEAQLGTNHLENARGPFLAKLDNSGEVLWVDVPSGQFEGEFTGMVVNEHDIFVQGRFQGEIRLQEFTLFSQAPTVYLAKYDLNGTVLWVKQIGTLNEEVANSSMAADVAGNVYFAGNFIDGVRLATNVVQNQGSDLLLAKLELAPLIVQHPVSHFAQVRLPYHLEHPGEWHGR